VMRTPGEEARHAAGFCLGEGIVDQPGDIDRIGFDHDLDPNVIDVWLRPERRAQVRELLGRRRFVSQTSCGICGKELIEDLHQILTPTPSGFEVDAGEALGCLGQLSDKQQYYQTTRGSHASLIFDDRLEVIAFAEDVGRHNSLDKAIGAAFLEGTLPRAAIAVLSSRVSYELIQKAARAHLAMLLSHSRPTALAAELGRSLNMTLAFPDGESELLIICGEQRIRS
jgi:FdhD protein